MTNVFVALVYFTNSYNEVIIRRMRNIYAISTYEVIKCQPPVAIIIGYFLFKTPRYPNHSASRVLCSSRETKLLSFSIDRQLFIFICDHMKSVCHCAIKRRRFIAHSISFPIYGAFMCVSYDEENRIFPFLFPQERFLRCTNFKRRNEDFFLLLIYDTNLTLN